MKKIYLYLIILLIIPTVSFADSIPRFPMAFWGNATLNGQQLSNGTSIKAYCGEDLVGEVTMLENGIYGYIESTKIKLLVGSCTKDILFKYLLLDSTNILTGGNEIKYTDGFQSGVTVNKDLNFITTQSCNIENGVGLQNWTQSGWVSCTLVSCNNGYTSNNNICVANNSGGGGGSGGGLSYITPTVIKPVVNPLSNNALVIPGCGDRKVGFSITTGKSCIGNTGIAVSNSGIGKVLGVSSFSFTKLIKIGSKGDEVMELQKFLNNAGYNVGIADGQFGPKTKMNLIKFQITNGLKGDGIVGPKVRILLNK